MVEEFIRQPGKAHRLQQTGIKGFSSATGFPFFHLKAVTKVVLHNSTESNRAAPAFPQCVQKPQTQGAAQPLEPQHVILSGFRERKLPRERTGGKKSNTGG